MQQVRYDTRRAYHVVARPLPVTAPRRPGLVGRPAAVGRRRRREDVAPVGGAGVRVGRASGVDYQLAGEASGGGGGDEQPELVAPFVGRVHGEEAQDEEVHGGRDDGETGKDEDQTEDDVAGSRLQHPVRLHSAPTSPIRTHGLALTSKCQRMETDRSNNN